MPAWRNIWKSIDVIHHISKLKKGKTNNFTSIDARKGFDKIQHLCLIKNPQQSRKRREVPQCGIYEKLKANI